MSLIIGIGNNHDHRLHRPSCPRSQTLEFFSRTFQELILPFLNPLSHTQRTYLVSLGSFRSLIRSAVGLTTRSAIRRPLSHGIFMSLALANLK